MHRRRDRALRWPALALALAGAPAAASAEDDSRGWRKDPTFQAIAARLDAITAVDNHTHLLQAEGFNPAFDAMQPLGLRSSRPETLAFLVERYGVPVHIHSSHGVPPFLRLHESDVRNLDLVLTDPRFFGTSFVLIHGGLPLVEEAAYLGIKPHVWIDVSAQPFLYPVPDLASNLRKYLLFAPEKVLFGTDPGDYPGVPVGPEVLHAVASRALREALSLALAGLVRDGVVDLETAGRLGLGVLRDNAMRLYGWTSP